MPKAALSWALDDDAHTLRCSAFGIEGLRCAAYASSKGKRRGEAGGGEGGLFGGIFGGEKSVVPRVLPSSAAAETHVADSFSSPPIRGSLTEVALIAIDCD